jgi:phosphatidylglycerophosphate synthase
VQDLRTVPNALSAVRLITIPLLWLLAIRGLTVVLGVALLLSFLTDALDGPIARRLHQSTEFGSRLDSLADNLLLLSIVAWLVMLRPQVWEDHSPLIEVALVMYAASLILGLVKFGRFANLHLYTSKGAAVLGCIFVVHGFIFGSYSPWLFYPAIGLFTVSSTETFTLQLVRSRLDEHVGSLLRVRTQRPDTARSPWSRWPRLVHNYVQKLMRR